MAQALTERPASAVANKGHNGGLGREGGSTASEYHRKRAVRLVRKRSRLMHQGKTVTARLPLRSDPALAGAALNAHVEPVDARDPRQLERNAATIRTSH
jgi:hypothetical protein